MSHVCLHATFLSDDDFILRDITVRGAPDSSRAHSHSDYVVVLSAPAFME
jgi:hypothetical protein